MGPVEAFHLASTPERSPPEGGKPQGVVLIWTHDPQAHGTFLQFSSLRACVQLIKGTKSRRLSWGLCETLCFFSFFFSRFSSCLAPWHFLENCSRGILRAIPGRFFYKEIAQKSVERDSLEGSKLLETTGGFYESWRKPLSRKVVSIHELFIWAFRLSKILWKETVNIF